jgi:signal peptidase I
LVDELFADGRNVKIRVAGTSMLPTLSESDVIELESLNEEPHMGDVLLFCIAGNYVVHRLIGRDGDFYVLQGDNNYVTERVNRKGLIARVVNVNRADGTVVSTNSEEWHRLSRHSIRRKRLKNAVIRWFGRRGRRQLRPWYFAALAILMWAPLNGLGIPLDNYILGLRADHLLHASVFIPCALFLWDVVGPKWLVWLVSVTIGLVAEGGQWLLPYRGYDINDLMANAIGVTLGLVVIILCRRAIRRRRQCPGRAKRGGCR